MRVVYASSEAAPFAKTGGLADVAGALPPALARAGADTAVFIPLYAKCRESGLSMEKTGVRLNVSVGGMMVDAGIWRSDIGGVPVYLVEQDGFFDRPELYGTIYGDYPDNMERFAFFSRAVIEAVNALAMKPDVFHVNDWQTALIPVYAKTVYENRKLFRHVPCLLTIHNMTYQGMFPAQRFPLLGLDWRLFNWREMEFYGRINLLKGGIVFSEAVSTVSRKYAEEITAPEYGAGLDGVLRERSGDLYGIINGVDYAVWNPSSDVLIPARYDADSLHGKAKCKKALQKEMGLPVKKGVPLIGMVGRLVDQKGLDIFSAALDGILKLGVQTVVLGTGMEHYHRVLTRTAAASPEKLAVKIGFDNGLAHRIEAGCDMFLMPSRFEPCGLNQLYSLRYGTVPIVHAVGGLADTVKDWDASDGAATGFCFHDYSPSALLEALRRALALYARPREWRRLMVSGMKQDWSWNRSASEYMSLYSRILEG